MRRPVRWLALPLLVAASAPAAVTVHAAAAPASIALRPNCGPAGPAAPAGVRPTYAIEVLGRGLAPGPIALVFNPGPQQQSFPAQVGDGGGLDVTIQPAAVPAGSYTVEVQRTAVEGPPLVGPTAIFLVPCPTPPASPSPGPSARPSTSRNTPPPRVLNPALTLTPAVGPPGTVTVARGTDFPASIGIQLAWSQGIAGTTPAPIVTDGSGAFTAAVLVLPHDELGARVLTAVSIVPPDSSLLGFASAAFLVTPGAVQPRDFSWRR